MADAYEVTRVNIEFTDFNGELHNFNITHDEADALRVALNKLCQTAPTGQLAEPSKTPEAFFNAIRGNRKIDAIKALRESLTFSLKQAKDAVEFLMWQRDNTPMDAKPPCVNELLGLPRY